MKERLWTLTHSAALGTARASETVTDGFYSTGFIR